MTFSKLRFLACSRPFRWFVLGEDDASKPLSSIAARQTTTEVDM